MKKCLRIGLIGVGGVGGYHLNAIQELEQEGLLRLVAVADPVPERFPALEPEMQARGVRWHRDYREMLEHDLDAVTIASPIPLHYEMARACLDRGIFVHMEKPPVPLIQQLDELIQRDPENRVAVGFQMIGSQCVQKAKRLILSGALGEISEIRICGCWPRHDRYYQRASWAGKMLLGEEPVFDGPATNGLAHPIHNLMYLASGETGGFEVPTEIQGELYRARPIESYDVACMRGKFRSGTRFVVAVTHATESLVPYRLEIQGSRGWMRLDEDGSRLDISTTERFVCHQDTQELLRMSHHDFHKRASGGKLRALTTLNDCRGYVLATNGMLASSGGIHKIDDCWIRTYGNNGDSGFDVAGLKEAVNESFRTGLLFSELGVPWAKSTSPVPVENLRAIDLPKYVVAPANPPPPDIVREKTAPANSPH